MTMNKDKNTVAAAGIAGAIIGAGVTAAAVALSDKKNRDKAVSAINDATVHAKEMWKKRINAEKKVIDEVPNEPVKHAEKAAEEAKKSLVM